MKDAVAKTALIVGTGVLWAVGALVSAIAVVKAYPGWTPVLWAFVVIPVTEEVVRYGAARAVLWRADARTAAAIGLVCGSLEVISKALQYGFAVEEFTSLPIHVALSMVFYSSERWRVPKAILAHALLNLTLGTLASFQGVSVYAILLITFAVSALLVVLAQWGSTETEERHF